MDERARCTSQQYAWTTAFRDRKWLRANKRLAINIKLLNINWCPHKFILRNLCIYSSSYPSTTLYSIQVAGATIFGLTDCHTYLCIRSRALTSNLLLFLPLAFPSHGCCISIHFFCFMTSIHRIPLPIYLSIYSSPCFW
ncbi:hypothetical protein BDV19DRAFT_291802 [Aspergillus venezuelensis]